MLRFLAQYPEALLFSIGGHLLLLLLLVWGTGESKPAASGNTIMLDQVAAQQSFEAQTRAEANLRQQNATKARQQAKAKARQQAEAKARQQAKAKARQQAEAKARQQAEAKARQQAEAKARQQAEAKARQQAEAKARQQAEAKARQQAEAKAQAARQQVETQARQQQAKAQQARQQLSNKNLETLKKNYEAAIAQRVKSNWLRPVGTSNSSYCQVMVEQRSNGTVISVLLLHCEQNSELFASSVEHAVRKASPLPLPPRPELFERYIRFVFKATP